MTDRQKRLLDFYCDGYIRGPQFCRSELSHQITTRESEGKQEDVDRSNRIRAANALNRRRNYWQ